MKHRQTLLTIIAVAVIVCGCHTPGERIRTVRIESEPPGMAVYFGIAGADDRAARQREYVGKTPCQLDIECDEQGRFVNRVSSFARPVATFYADPPASETNLFPQSQSFAVPAMFIRPPPIPRAVYFDMRKTP
jgi:hypothetical protein